MPRGRKKEKKKNNILQEEESQEVILKEVCHEIFNFYFSIIRAHLGPWLSSVHHTVESSSAVFITPRSQTAHRRVKIENFAGHIYHERIDLKFKKKGFTKTKNLTPGCHAHRGVRIF